MTKIIVTDNNITPKNSHDSEYHYISLPVTPQQRNNFLWILKFPFSFINSMTCSPIHSFQDSLCLYLKKVSAVVIFCLIATLFVSMLLSFLLLQIVFLCFFIEVSHLPKFFLLVIFKISNHMLITVDVYYWVSLIWFLNLSLTTMLSICDPL